MILNRHDDTGGSFCARMPPVHFLAMRFFTYEFFISSYFCITGFVQDFSVRVGIFSSVYFLVHTFFHVHIFSSDRFSSRNYFVHDFRSSFIQIFPHSFHQPIFCPSYYIYLFFFAYFPLMHFSSSYFTLVNGRLGLVK